jgi:DNA invertase Pin-like site-specific DNA recombinase
MLVGYMRVSKADGSQVFDLQRDALLAAGVKRKQFYEDRASGKKDNRPGLEACLKALRRGDTLVVWKLDRLGRSLRHLVNTVHGLMEEKTGFRVLTGLGANIDTRTASGRLVFGIFASLAEFERELIRERTIAGLMSARARGRTGAALQNDRAETAPHSGSHGQTRNQGRRLVQRTWHNAANAVWICGSQGRPTTRRKKTA